MLQVNRQKKAEYDKVYRRKNAKRISIYYKRYRETHPRKALPVKLLQRINPIAVVKKRVRAKTRNALLAGKIAKQLCKVCGSSTVQAHHPDYSKPLEVIWRCRKHHLLLHRKYK